MKIAEVVFSLPVNRSFSYSVPAALEEIIKPGMRVKAPFGPRKLIGFVVETYDARRTTPDGKILKEIIKAVDEEPVVTPEIIELCRWVSSYYSCSLGRALQAAVPVKRSVKTQVSSIQYPVSSQQATSSEERATDFTEGQRQAFDAVRECIGSGKHGVFLFEGPYHSGKTEVCLAAVVRARAAGKSVLMIVPEISSVPKLLGRIASRLPEEKTAVLHSGLKSGEMGRLWDQVRNGGAGIVIGTRSAVFSPLKNIGLIIVEGEEDDSLKEQQEPRYHARETAVARAEQIGAAVILESESPSLESRFRAGKGDYRLCLFQSLPGFNIKPLIEIIDRKQPQFSRVKSRIFSAKFIEELRSEAERGGRMLLFVNRRGFSPLFMCADCGKSMHCPHCETPLSFHKPGRLLCHYCNYSSEIPDFCPDCKSREMRSFGAGTQLVCEELRKMFSGMIVERYDADTVEEGLQADRILDDFRSGKAQILVGTQILENKDLGKVPFLGIVLADLMLNIPDFRSSERTFRVITKFMKDLAPAAEGTSPKVVIQTYNPGHFVFQALEKGYEFFFESEIKMRRRLRYPPFASLVNIIVSGNSSPGSEKTAESIAEALRAGKELKGRSFRMDILGPAPAPVAMLKDRYRYEIMLRGKKTALDSMLKALKTKRLAGGSERVSIDVDPVRML